MATSNIENSVFSCRVFHCDYYLTKPLDKYDVAFSEFKGKPSKYCPVIRLFGSLQNGEKCCVHIHGVFPYLLICSHGPKTAITRQYLRHLTKSIDLALRVSFGAPRDTCYVFKITVVEAISMYGYYDTNQVFLKIFLYNPLLIKRLAELLLSGAILNRVMQPYEAHVPYILQFFIDYNLHGMNFLHLQAYKRRRMQKIDQSTSLSPSLLNSTNEQTYHDVPAVSVCSWEIDTVAADILNPKINVEKSAYSRNPGISALWEEERKRREKLSREEDLAPQPSADRDFCHVLPLEHEMLSELRTQVEVIRSCSQQKPTAMDTSDDMNEPDHTKKIDMEEHDEECEAGQVNENLIQHTMEMSQRLSNEAISQASGEDLLGLLLQLAASQTSGSEKQEDSSVVQVPGNSVVDFLSQSLHDISSASLPASHNVSLFDDSQLMPELAKLADGVSFSEMGMGDHQQIDPSIQVDGSLSIGEDTKLFHTPTPLEGIPSQTPPTPDSPKHKSDKSSLGDLGDLTVWKDSQLTYFLESSNLSTDQLTEISPDLAEEESILQRIVQGQEDKVETFLMSQTVWDEEEDCLPVPQNHEMPTRSSLPQLDGSNSESNKKPKPSSSKKRMKLGSTRRFKPMKSTSVAASLFPDPHSVPLCDKEHCLLQKEEVGEEEHTAPLLTSRKRLPSTQDQKDHDCEFEPVTVDQDRVNPSDVPGHDLEEELEVPHSKLLWNLLNSTVKVAKERKDEIKNVLDCIDKSYHEEEQEASGFECSPVKRSSANTECGESSVNATDSWKSSSPLCEVVCIAPVLSPPSMKELLADDERMHVCQHQEAFYSNLQDRQEPMRVGNHILQISLNLASEYKEFKPNCLDYSPCLNLAESGINHWDVVFNAVFPSVTDRPEVLAGVSVLTPVCPPPSYKCLKTISTSNTKSFLKKKNSSPSTPPSNDTVVIDGPTPANSFGFKLTPYCSEDSQIYGEENLNLLAMSVELHVRTCKGKRPNPETDPILCIFYYIHGTSGSTSGPALPRLGIITAEDLTRCSTEDINVVHVSSEKDLVVSICQLVCTYNPDILVGFEVQQLSWGYLNERAAFLNINLCQQLSRTPDLESKMDDSNKQASVAKQPTDMYVVGRCIINLWKLVRHEIALNIYTFENVAYHVLHQRLPHFSFETLTKWFDSTHPHLKWQVVDYYLRRCTANIEIIEKFYLIGRTSEFAKLYGILFSEVLSRGSQFRVESILLRLAHAKGFVGVSPGIQQRARMAAPECLPLILEPESRFYTDPVVVLDFQSLYPSIIIGHNYCFSTCLGRVQHVRSMSEEYKFGATSMFLPSNVLKLINDDQVTISPNGVVFVKSATRKGLIPEMLQEILDTRVMVKKSMKMYKDNKKLEKILDARQMGLKLIANVTYGYTGAHFSGRMPCVEVADSIVAKARETVDRAIRLVNSTKKWNAKVVYGDTDSMFVLLKGASKDQAFKIGQEIVSEVTAMNPKPVKLKFEKVYLPCVLQTKKRYVGFMYESEDQSEPVFDAKGIETVRRDNCPAVSKILEKSIKLLFSTKDVSNCKIYIQSQLRKLLEGRVALSDYTFAKEYRGESSYRPGACVPALSLARQAMLLDKRAEPRVGERVPYVVVCGTPGLPLFKLIRRPEDFLANPGFRLNATYYASKQILPALNRVFSLLGANVFNWYKEISIFSRVNVPSTNPKLKGTLGDYFASMHCPICGRLTGDDVCESCKRDNQALVVKSLAILRNSEKRLSELNTICQVCCSNADVAVTQECSALFCPVFNKRTSSLRCAQTARLKDVINKQEQW